MPAIEQRNIVFCLFDSLSAADSVSGSVLNALPTLATLCNGGVLFNRVYAPNPESSPARASLFTGLDPCAHGLWTNGVTLPDHERTFAQRLAQAGYTNYLAGRYQLSGLSHWTTEQTRTGEFTNADWAHGPLHRSRQNGYLVWLQETAPEKYAQIFTSQANSADTLQTPQQRTAIEALPDELSFNYWVGQQIGEWIASHSPDQPFMAMAGFSVGDGLGTEPHKDTDVEALMPLALKQADAAMGQILNQLEHSNLAKQTVFIVASARGCTSGDTTGNQALHESLIKVPVVIYGGSFRQQTIDATVSTIDIAPTILDIVNLSVGARMQGQSLLDVINESKKPRGWAMSRLRTNLSTGESNWHTALCKNAMKLVVHHNDKKDAQELIQLYNLDGDPAEQDNLAVQETHAQDLESMIDQMIDARCALEDRTEPRIADF